jgi:hypothetical protein
MPDEVPEGISVGAVARSHGWRPEVDGSFKFSIDGRTPARITLTSDYIQNLSATGRVAATGAIELSEPLWLGEENRNTVWEKQ